MLLHLLHHPDIVSHVILNQTTEPLESTISRAEPFWRAHKLSLKHCSCSANVGQGPEFLKKKSLCLLEKFLQVKQTCRERGEVHLSSVGITVHTLSLSWKAFILFFTTGAEMQKNKNKIKVVSPCLVSNSKVLLCWIDNSGKS